MTILTKIEVEKMKSDSYSKGYSEGLEKGRALAHEEEYLQDINFADITFVFDFYHSDIKVFSIERTAATGADPEQTVIGYTVKSDPGMIKQWYFSCSRTHHNKLVEQWQEAKRSPFVKKK